jgi:alpha-tubulin suppressor-like RCC1 family protein
MAAVVAALMGSATAVGAGGSVAGAKVLRYVGDAPGSVTCSVVVTTAFSPPLTDSGGGTNPTKVTGKLDDCTASNGSVTITSGKITGSFAPKSAQNCANLTSLTTPATFTVKWKGSVDGAIGATTYDSKASFTPSTITSEGEAIAGSEFGFPTSANPRVVVTGSFAGGSTATLDTSVDAGSLGPICDSKATGGTGKGLKKLVLGGSITIGLTTPLSSAVSMATDGHQSFCAIVTTGTIQCWGDNSTGELGDGTTTTSTVAQQVSNIANATAVASDDAHSYCAIVGSGAIDCWGSNMSGQLGNGATSNSSIPVAVTGITTAISVTGDGDGSYCAVLESGDVNCWGANSFGQLGDGTATASSVPVVVTGITTATAVTGDGDGTYCAVLESGDVNCWGANSFGQLGDGTKTTSLVATAVTGLTNASGVSSDDVDSFCAEQSSETVACWGANFAGELGNGTTTLSTVPVAVTGITTASAVSDDGAESYCALLASGAVDCWGFNAFGQLGNATTVSSSVPVAVSGIFSATSVVSDSENSYCAVLGSDGVDCWGANSSGELGNGTTTASSVPVPVSGVSSVAAVTGGDNPSGDNERSYCAVFASGGRISCWGSNKFGELGNATTIDSSTPVAVVEP